ncbi:ATP synthase F1 subcomplex epsilon subunit [Maritimibacter alkaliphilus HTCC2654]|uniref:ATP synthase epsilon chain n=1 Tax=Maritimibacter alkaliphilus HTCC2654 TaxID=314271 RepID=A3VAD7_9RHOB|nr:F0F1 ATP synthase subunit epsilon [Maritimibacter alkaliphilus]EAQ14878.1 ATP synthase F1, epsilon subunit [Maritimibacter alkaliphilus HTCC2654]TYP80895.1 ATP synthase F1 subcomplex epsilon subunit [Maritimibacter alkaliphilus HTCC2654]
MADMMQFDLVSPERRLTSTEASAVQIPGADGDFTAMAQHAPTIATLRPGIVTVQGAGGEERYVVTGGFAEVTPDGTTVLAERAMPAGEVTQDIIDDFVATAVAARDNATPEMLDQLSKQVGDIALVASELGLQSKA